MTSVLEDVVERIRQHPKLIFADDFEIAAQSVRRSRHRFRNGEPVEAHGEEEVWVSLRILHRKSPGRSVTTGLTAAAVDDLVESAFHSARCSLGDPWFRFPIWKRVEAPEALAPPAGEPASLVAALPPGVPLIEEAYERREERTLLHRKTERFQLSRSRAWQGTRFSVVSRSADGVVGFDEERVHGDGGRRFDWLKRLLEDGAAYGRAPRWARSAGRLSLVLGPHTLTALLGAIAPWFCSDRLRRRQSPLDGQDPAHLFSPVLSLVDHGHYPDSPLGAPFDLEGSLTRETVLVGRGALKSLLFDSYEAARENRLSTGNLLRGHASPWPAIQPSTLFFRPASSTPEALWKEAGEGLWVERLERLKPLPDAPWRFELEGCGARLARGEPVERLRGIRIPFDAFDLLRRAVDVGNDLTFHGSYGSPSILFEKVPI